MRNGLVALGIVAAFAAFAAPASAAPRCKPGHDVLARRRGQVVIWATLTRHNRRVRNRVYVCVSRYGGAHVVDTETRNVHPRVTRLQVAGNFVGFFLATQQPNSVGPLENLVTDVGLYVFDGASRRVDLRDLVSCQGSACAFVPEMTQYVLTANGWLLELYNVSDASPHATTDLRELDATYAPTAARVPLDFGLTISGPALSGETASWNSDLGGATSAALGPSLVPSTTPQAISACQLLSTSDVSPLLGPVSSSGSPSQCQYSGASRTLALSFKTGLSSQQVKSDVRALAQNNSFGPISLSHNEYSIYAGTTTISGVTHEQLTFFAANSGSEVTLDLTAPSGNADEQLAWLANVAFDRLFGIPVQRTN